MRNERDDAGYPNVSPLKSTPVRPPRKKRGKPQKDGLSREELDKLAEPGMRKLRALLLS
jgi:hypothetical protein